MSIWLIIVIVFLAGALGGLINAFLSDNGFLLPRREPNGAGYIIRPGFVGNIFIGGVAACVSWGLYGPLAAYDLVPSATSQVSVLSLTITAIFGAVLIGIGGARWLTSAVDKTLLKAAASNAARSPEQ